MADRFDTLLVANRGEIALRIIRTARTLGYRTVAVASEADRDAPHAKAADRCVVIGPAPVGQSYLDQDAIIDAARATGAQAIHPGYGFLSENAVFARNVRDEGLVFIGPSPEAIDLMGDKARAKRAMINAGVPCIPGYQGDAQDETRFISAAEEAGYPVMVKAAAGGGGRGMRMVTKPADLPAALSDARREAESAFGSGDLILEKAVEHARHVEIQVFGDAHGAIIHLGERDCSLQRRHQKVIEEAPSPAVDAELRARMGQAAIDAARVVSYQGAGTIEFLLAPDGEFFFLEMNTRLQVEHPATEEVTGLDLVALQLRVAQGLPLDLVQDAVAPCGHAIQARLYAEDPANGFLPSTGPVLSWRPATAARTDAGIETGGSVSSHYDPMVAKVIARGATREEARRKLIRALEETSLIGLRHNRAFLLGLLRDPVFADGEATTGLIDGRAPVERSAPPPSVTALGAVLHHLLALRATTERRAVPRPLLHWQSGHAIASVYSFGEDGDCSVSGGPERFKVSVGDEPFEVAEVAFSEGQGSASVGGVRIAFSYLLDGASLHLVTPDRDDILTNRLSLSALGAEAAGAGDVTAPMHGLVTDVFVEEGTRVAKGQRLALLEAMKMQHEVKAPVAGTVRELPVKAGTQLASGDLIAAIEPDTEETP